MARAVDEPGAKSPSKLTPVMRQHQEAKDAYPDAILFFRLGDFYEMFGEDAVLAARELQLTLTSRNKGAPDEVPMAGVPVHAAHNYVAKLIARGHKVAICEQLADPSKCKGIVPRKVVRVVTPGLMTDTSQLDARQNNYLVAIEGGAEAACCGLARLEVSTGELAATEVDGRALLVAELCRTDPAEVLLAEPLAGLRPALQTACPRATFRPDEPLGEGEVERCLSDGLPPGLYADAARDHGPLAVRAAARALRFARRALPDAAIPVRRIARHDAADCLRLDETAQSHLELVRGADGTRRGSLLEVIDVTLTAGGARLLRRRLLAPLCEVAAIRRRLDEVEMFVAHPRAREELRRALRRVGDLERLATRAALGESSPRDLGAIRDSLQAAPDALGAVASIPTAAAPGPGPEGGPGGPEIYADCLPDARELLQRALADALPAHARDGGMLRQGYDAQLDEYKRIRQGGTELIVALETALRTSSGIPSLKVKYTGPFGWFVEVTKAHLGKVPAEWRRKQTLSTVERYTNRELDELADRLMHAEERHAQREAQLFAELCTLVARRSEALRQLARTLAQWDVAAARADVAHRCDDAKPAVDDGPRLELVDARHPVVERYVASGAFVPNDTTLDLEGERLLLITGPNMAGKSTLMRQVALCTILAQMGSYVPARSARMGVVDRVLSRVGASDNLARGESTFMVEMREAAAILRSATRRSLVVVDEIGRGTSTFDGLAIAWAVAEHVFETVGCRAMFATHYHELTELANRFPGIANYSVSAREHEGRLVFLHRLTPGSVSRSYGVAVARLAGLPEGVLARAAAILSSLEGAQAPPAAAPAGPRRRAGTADTQLDLFRPRPEPPAPARSPGEQAALDVLGHIEIDRMTPIEALQLLTRLRAMIVLVETALDGAAVFDRDLDAAP
ncbi:MAG: DNA mismatch repair protein MutS [Deltaproteobacteria bacterium]|nr:DNA mismatch repair protein MutS [Deltaproteobacteria bacterium]